MQLASEIAFFIFTELSIAFKRTTSSAPECPATPHYVALLVICWFNVATVDT